MGTNIFTAKADTLKFLQKKITKNPFFIHPLDLAPFEVISNELFGY